MTILNHYQLAYTHHTPPHSIKSIMYFVVTVGNPIFGLFNFNIKKKNSSQNNRNIVKFLRVDTEKKIEIEMVKFPQHVQCPSTNKNTE